MAAKHNQNLTWEVAFRNLWNIEDERQRSDEVHYQDSWDESLEEQRWNNRSKVTGHWTYSVRSMRAEHHLSHLYELWGEAPGDEDPVGCGDQAVSHHRAEDERAQLLPLLTEVVWVDLSEEDGENHGQNCHQVHLPPVLQRQEVLHGHRVCAWLHVNTITEIHQRAKAKALLPFTKFVKGRSANVCVWVEWIHLKIIPL